MPFVSYYYDVLGKDVMDWMAWPINGLTLAIPMIVVGYVLSLFWPPFAWLVFLAFCIVFATTDYVLVFLAAAGIQLLQNQLELCQEDTARPVAVRLLVHVPLHLWIVIACVPAALSLPVFGWGVFRYNDSIIVAGMGLFLLPVFAILALAMLVRVTRSHEQVNET